MNKKAKILATTGVLTLGAIGAIGISNVVGATTNGSKTSLVESIATKFNLNKDEVQKVFDEHKTQMQAQREAEIKTQLEQLVKDGKLTQAQADAITAKRAELAKEREANKPTTKPSEMTEEQKAAAKTAREAKKAALDKWLEENKIDSQYRYLLGGKGGRGGKGGQPPAGENKTKPSPSTQSSAS